MQSQKTQTLWKPSTVTSRVRWSIFWWLLTPMHSACAPPPLIGSAAMRLHQTGLPASLCGAWHACQPAANPRGQSTHIAAPAPHDRACARDVLRCAHAAWLLSSLGLPCVPAVRGGLRREVVPCCPGLGTQLPPTVLLWPCLRSWSWKAADGLSRAGTQHCPAQAVCTAFKDRKRRRAPQGQRVPAQCTRLASHQEMHAPSQLV